MFLRTLCILIFAAVGATERLSAQGCFGPDGLNGPCWQRTTANLPPFPQAFFESVGLCWNGCDPQAEVCTVTTMQAPVQVACGQYTADMRVQDCAGNALLGGKLLLDYTRTWSEVTPPGIPAAEYQIWRLVAKVDLAPATTPVTPSCVIPSCLGTHPTAFYYGYVDYALNCETREWTTVAVLFHNCDQFIHDRAFSSTPGVFHPRTSFALVGPSTAANPFKPSIATSLSGPLVAEAVRNVPLAAGGPCITEDPIQGDIRFIAEGCACPFMLNPKQASARFLRGRGSCLSPVFGPTSFVSVKTPPPFPWLHEMVTSIGTWTTDASYPGQEFVWVSEAPILYRDSCVNANFGELYYGASTAKGWLVTTTPLTQNFVDLASNVSFPPTMPVFPMAGFVGPTRNLIYMNVP